MAAGLYPLWLLNFWGWPDENGCNFTGVIGPVYGTNPAYNLDTFFGMYPKFFGAPTLVSGCQITASLNTITVPSANGLLIGQFLQNGSLAQGSIITNISGNTITLNNAATATDANATLQVYEAQPVPASVIQSYINLATAQLSEAMWGEQWQIGMSWVVAHFCTLWAQTEASDMQTAMQTVMHWETPSGAIPGTVYTLSSAPPGGTLQVLAKNGSFLSPAGATPDYTLSGATITLTVATVAGDTLVAVWPIQQTISTSGYATPAQIAAQGVAQGILTSKSVGDVSASYQTLAGLEGWGAFQLSRYGQQLITAAAAIGSGPAFVW